MNDLARVSKYLYAEHRLKNKSKLNVKKHKVEFKNLQESRLKRRNRLNKI